MQEKLAPEVKLHADNKKKQVRPFRAKGCGRFKVAIFTLFLNILRPFSCEKVACDASKIAI